MTSFDPRILDGRPSVDLPTLNATAALLTRVDRKYVLTSNAAARFLAALPPGVAVLEIDGRRTFGYASTYLDTPRLESFLDTAHRRRRRIKVRTRTYLDSAERFVEVKARRAGQTVKTRLALAGASAATSGGPVPGGLDAPAAAFVADAARASGTWIDPGEWTPTLDVDYRRSTLLLPSGAGRLTVDSGLAWTDRASGRRLTASDLVVVETKSGSSPSDADRLLWALGHRPRPISKYATGLAALRPALPRNRWQRLLREPWGWDADAEPGRLGRAGARDAASGADGVLDRRGVLIAA